MFISEENVKLVEEGRKEDWRFHFSEFESGEKWKVEITRTTGESLENIWVIAPTLDEGLTKLFSQMVAC